MNEFEVRDCLRDKRNQIKTDEQLFEFIKDVKEKFNYGYGVAPRSIAQAAVAVADYLLCEMGCTSFQASCVMWDIIRDLNYTGNQCGLKIIDYDDFLYPQYKYKHQKAIGKDTWGNIQNQAKKNLEESGGCDEVREHWQKIVDGIVPFGYTVEND
mgnify:CR=1 FL=1